MRVRRRCGGAKDVCYRSVACYLPPHAAGDLPASEERRLCGGAKDAAIALKVSSPRRRGQIAAGRPHCAAQLASAAVMRCSGGALKSGRAALSGARARTRWLPAHVLGSLPSPTSRGILPQKVSITPVPMCVFFNQVPVYIHIYCCCGAAPKYQSPTVA
jgi:hypothetical protein